MYELAYNFITCYWVVYMFSTRHFQTFMDLQDLKARKTDAQHEIMYALNFEKIKLTTRLEGRTSL